MQALTPDAELDLRWYFTEANGACGLRSSMGASAERVKSGICSQRTATTGDREEDAMIRIVEHGAPARASRIASRLRLIGTHHQVTLEAQYSSPCDIPGTLVSPLLASVQPCAKATFKHVLDRRGRGKSKAKRSRLARVSTPLMWIQYLIDASKREPAGNEARIFGTILSQARDALFGACEAYNAKV